MSGKFTYTTKAGVHLESAPPKQAGRCFGCYLYENALGECDDSVPEGQDNCCRPDCAAQSYIWVQAAVLEVVSEWQDGHTLPQFPGLYQRQFSVVPESIFCAQDDEAHFHYFDGERWYVWGKDKRDAMREHERNNYDDHSKYRHAPWRGVIEVRA